MFAITRSARQAPVAPPRQQDTASQRWSWVGQIDRPLTTAISSGVYALVDPASSVVTYAGIVSSTFSTPYWQFQRLVDQWRRERGAESSVTKIAVCPSYQRIIAMGQTAVPMILRELENEGDEPDHWFWALSAITDADPVPCEARGDMVQMAEAWLDWGRQRYVW
jgi:hypothetical protein